MSAGLAEVLAEHLIETCGPRCATGFNYDSNDSTADRVEGIAHVAAAVAEWLGERLREAREEAVEGVIRAYLATDYCMNARISEVSDGHRETATEYADAALAAVGKALGVRG